MHEEELELSDTRNTAWTQRLKPTNKGEHKRIITDNMCVLCVCVCMKANKWNLTSLKSKPTEVQESLHQKKKVQESILYDKL